MVGEIKKKTNMWQPMDFHENPFRNLTKAELDHLRGTDPKKTLQGAGFEGHPHGDHHDILPYTPDNFHLDPLQIPPEFNVLDKWP